MNGYTFPIRRFVYFVAIHKPDIIESALCVMICYLTQGNSSKVTYKYYRFFAFARSLQIETDMRKKMTIRYVPMYPRARAEIGLPDDLPYLDLACSGAFFDGFKK